VRPVALARGEREGRDGAATIAGLVAGYEVATAVGEALASETTRRGFRASMLYGTLGAAAAAASLMALDARGCADAIAIAASFAGGLSQAWIEGSTEWRWELGMAARNGLQAARLAAHGERGAELAFEGAAGFARAFAGVEVGPSGLAEQLALGERWRIMDVIYKAYPVCNILQSPVEVALALVRRHGIAPESVRSLTLYLNAADRSYPGTLNDGPFADVGATLMSASYCVAMAVKDGSATLAGLRQFDDPTIASLIERTEVLGDGDLPELAARLRVHTTGGETFVQELIPDESTYGWDWGGVVANARRLRPEMLPGTDVERLVDVVGGLERLPDLEPLLAACASSGGR
jgi:2-methylcitrate dehydratase PrpD